MALRFTALYHQTVIETDIPRLPAVWKERIRRAIETRLTVEPALYGKPLRKSLAGYWKLRVGDYRVVYRIEGSFVKVLAILHRSVVYKIIDKRK